MARRPSESAAEKTYIHPTVIDDEWARRLARACIRDQQSFALVRDKNSWQAWCPLDEKDRFIDHIENTEED